MSTPESGTLQKSAADESYSRLRKMLVRRDFQPGMRLLEAELTPLLGVSRTPLREALRRLQGDGLVTLTGRGAIVTETSHSEILDLYRYRAALEGLTAELATERNLRGELAPVQLERLARLRDEVESGADASSTAVANLELHRYIAVLSDNRFVVDALSRVWDIISISSVENIEDDTEWRHSIDEHHRDIVAAIVAGNPEAARRTAHDHVTAAGAVYKRHTETN